MLKDYFISTNDLLQIDENCNAFLFDLNHRLIDFNAGQFELLKHILHIKSRDDVLGKRICELHALPAAEIVINENNLVINTKKAHTFFNFIKVKNYKSMMFSTLKTPTYDVNNQINGILGIAFHLAFYTADAGFNKSLSQREYECLTHLIKAKTASAIAKEIGLSKRTVETHIENIKNKLHCRSKAELMSKVFDIGLMSLLPGSESISESFKPGSFLPNE